MDVQETHKPTAAPSWVAVDWGTSNLRVWVMDAEGGIISALKSDKGMSGLVSADYETVLVDLLSEHLRAESVNAPLPVVVCGMAGSRSGWLDAGYVDLPVTASELMGSTVSVPTDDKRLSVHVLSGLRQMHPADVMRGEETQLVGFAESNPGFVGHLCLPGTHSKWVMFEAGRIANSQTVMTGELFDILRNHSILANSVASEADAGLSTAAFLEGVERGYSNAGAALGQLFSLRAEDLVGYGRTNHERLAVLSGLLVGSEFLTVAPSADLPIVFIGSGKLGPLYKRAARHLGFDGDSISGEELVLLGLKRAYETLKASETRNAQEMAQ
ncbi:MAG: 2-dehydro-3-deoxygalactonokinase [Pseudomonadota bacterium]